LVPPPQLIPTKLLGPRWVLPPWSLALAYDSSWVPSKKWNWAQLELWYQMTHPQLLEGFKKESQVEDNGKREGVGARSLIRSTRGVEGRARAPGLGLGRVTSFIHLLEPASNHPQSG
jgi:hypothetical protein